MSELEQFRHDIVRQAETISSVVTEMRKIKDEFVSFRSGVESDRRVRVLEDEHINERFDRLESQFRTLFKLGLWIVGAFGAAFITGAANFVVNGGLSLGVH